MPQALAPAELLVSAASGICAGDLLAVKTVNLDESFIVFGHVLCDVSLLKDRQQVGPVLLQIIPHCKKLGDSAEISLEAIYALFENFSEVVVRD